MLFRKSLVSIGLTITAIVLSASITGFAEEQQITTRKPYQPQALAAAGISELKQLDPNLNGADVSVAVICRSLTYTDGQPGNDYQPDANHNCFNTTKFTFHDRNALPASISPHSTAICSILFGKDPNAAETQLGSFDYEAAIPDANAQIYEFWHFLTDSVFTQAPPDADIITTAVGDHTPQWWTRGLESLAEKYGVIIVAGIGNGSNAFDPPLYPAAGANCLGVGVVDSVDTNDLLLNLSNFSIAHPEHSSFAPTLDGRCKPDIVAPGNCLAAVTSEPNLYEPTGNWTSFATPVVTGAVGLLVQKAKLEPNLSEALSAESGNCVIKAVLMNSADKLAFWHKGSTSKEDDHIAPLDYIQGSGMLNAPAAYKQLTAGRQNPGDVPNAGWDLNALEPNQTSSNSYQLTTADANAKILTATLVWNRHYRDNYPFEPLPQQDTDIRLELWAVNPDYPAEDYLLDYSDSTADNVEHIYCSLDADYKNFDIVVSYSDINEPQHILPPQSYAIAWNVSEKQKSDDIFLYDLNTDGIVNENDYIVLFDNWMNTIKSPAHYFLGDINADGVFDTNDMNSLNEQMNRQADWLNTKSSNISDTDNETQQRPIFVSVP